MSIPEDPFPGKIPITKNKKSRKQSDSNDPETSNLKIAIHLFDYLTFHTDENNKKTLPEIAEECYDYYKVSPTQRTIKSYIDDFQEMGYEIKCDSSDRYNGYRYYVENGCSQNFLFIMMLLLENANSISISNTMNIMEYLLRLAPQEIRSNIRQIFYFYNENKTLNEETINTIEQITIALLKKSCLTFRSFSPGYNGTRLYAHDGEYYFVEPIAIVPEANQFYLYGLSRMEGSTGFRHFRIDYLDSVQMEMQNISKEALDELERLQEKHEGIIKMFSGEQIDITVRYPQKILRSMLDRFGSDLKADLISGEGTEAILESTITTQDTQFVYSWIAESNGKIQVIAPERAVQGISDYVTERFNAYVIKTQPEAGTPDC